MLMVVSNLTYGEYYTTDPNCHESLDKISDVKIKSEMDTLMVELSPNQIVYYGYPPMECVTVSAVATGGEPPYSFLWNNGETNSSFEVCPLESDYYIVTVIDADGNEVKDSTRVCVIDVRCGNNLNKVEICHYPPGNPGNFHTLCIGMPAVNAHLAHGDSIGSCEIERRCTDTSYVTGISLSFTQQKETYLKVFPNPAANYTTVLYKIDNPGAISITLINSLGQVKRSIENNITKKGEIHKFELNLTGLHPGIYFLILQQENNEILTQKLSLNN
jgi:hypothetical protein